MPEQLLAKEYKQGDFKSLHFSVSSWPIRILQTEPVWPPACEGVATAQLVST